MTSTDKENSGEWKHCSPDLLHAGLDCNSTPRRPCGCGHGSHDHYVQYGKLAKHFCNEELPLRVLKSHAGYYIGTYKDFPEGEAPIEELEKCGPVSRESVEYFPTEGAAFAALETGEWTQKRSL